MRVGTEDKKKLILLSVLGVAALGAVFYLYQQLFASPDVPTPVATQPAAVAPGATNVGGASGSRPGGAAPIVGTTSAHLDPTLKMGPMLLTESLTYTGSGRNIFSGTAAAPVAIPKPVAPVRTKIAAAPVYTPPPGPPPPPPIDLKFFGTATRDGVRQAFLLRGEDVFLASAGDIVQRRYKVVSIAANSIVVEDLVNSNRQTLPLIAN